MSITKKRFIISHLVLRVLIVGNVIELAVASFSHTYFQWQRQVGLSNAVLWWDFISSLVFPLYVIFEFSWMWSVKSQRRPLIVDAVLVLGWFLTLWGGGLYMLTHRLTL